MLSILTTVPKCGCNETSVKSFVVDPGQGALHKITPCNGPHTINRFIRVGEVVEGHLQVGTRGGEVMAETLQRVRDRWQMCRTWWPVMAAGAESLKTVLPFRLL